MSIQCQCICLLLVLYTVMYLQIVIELKVTIQELSPQQVLHFYCLDMAQRSVTWAVNHAVIVTHFILFYIMVTFHEPNITYTSLRGFIDILKEVLFFQMFSYPKTYVVDVGWRKETEWHKLFCKVLKLTDLKYLNDRALTFFTSA